MTDPDLLPHAAVATQRPFVLLDDATAHDRAPTARLYTGYRREHRCTDPHLLAATWAAARQDAADGLHLVVLADYEWGVRLAGKAPPGGQLPAGGALRLLVFDTLQAVAADAVDPWLAAAEGCVHAGAAGLMDAQASVTAERYRADIDRVLAYIRSGDVYQVNHTYRLQGQVFGSPIALYRRLRRSQPVAFGALVHVPVAQAGDPHWVLSSSPELFVEHHAGRLRTRPMKGTAPRGGDAAQDEALRQGLAADVKNRAENLMIVDLLRNDLGRIAQIGSVRVPRLFEIERYRTVHQMTSTVEAQAAPGTDFPDVLRALFPCGSVTGAPKVRAMQVIDELEDEPRGAYTGAIGWCDAPRMAAATNDAIGDFCLSVAIRTITLGAADANGLRAASMGVGGGIVADSTAAEEWEETRVKARFLTGLDPGFGLFETMRVGPGLGAGRTIARLEDHLARLARSAQALGFACDVPALRAVVRQQVAALSSTQAHRLRLDLAFDGTLRVSTAALVAPSTAPATFLCADDPLPLAERALVAHKTTLRTTYDAAIAQAGQAGAFDMLFFNEQGQLTEGARSNVFVQIDGRWWTPPLACGLLPGVMRQRVLRRLGPAAERVLTREDLARATAVCLCNSLRGLRRVAPG